MEWFEKEPTEVVHRRHRRLYVCENCGMVTADPERLEHHDGVTMCHECAVWYQPEDHHERK